MMPPPQESSSSDESLPTIPARESPSSSADEEEEESVTSVAERFVDDIIRSAKRAVNIKQMKSKGLKCLGLTIVIENDDYM